MATSILLKFLTLKWNISRTISRIEVGDGSVFCIFHTLLFELNFFVDRRFPLIPNFKLEYEDSENVKIGCVNTVIFNVHKLKQELFWGHQVCCIFNGFI